MGRPAMSHERNKKGSGVLVWSALVNSFEKRTEAELRRLAIEAWIFRDKDSRARPNRAPRPSMTFGQTSDNDDELLLVFGLIRQLDVNI